MELYRAGHLTKVQRLGGGPAFNPEEIAKLVTLDALATMASDPITPAKRASRCGSSSRTSFRATRRPSSPTRSSSSSRIRSSTSPAKPPTGSARSPTPRRVARSSTRSRKADKDNRQKFLEALRDGIGGEGLVLALEQRFEREGRDDLAPEQAALRHAAQDRRSARRPTRSSQYMGTKPHIHWETEAALRLAEMGDLRAVPYLASRLRLDPLKVYSDTNDYERMQKRDDNARVVAARMLADLAMIAPRSRAPTFAPRPKTR